MDRQEPFWEANTPVERSTRRRTAAAALAGLALSGFGLSLAACQGGEQQEGTTHFTDTEARITGDPAVSARVEITPEGTAPFDAAITALGVPTEANLPAPVETTCVGTGGQDVILTLRSGRQLRYQHCAMPDEIVRIRDAAWAHDSASSSAATHSDSRPTDCPAFAASWDPSAGRPLGAMPAWVRLLVRNEAPSDSFIAPTPGTASPLIWRVVRGGSILASITVERLARGGWVPGSGWACRPLEAFPAPPP